jgi:hypothetical protein
MAVKAHDGAPEEAESPGQTPESITEEIEDNSIVGGMDDEVREAIQAECELDFFGALKLYPKAIGWSAFFSLGVIMLAFDPQLLG